MQTQGARQYKFESLKTMTYYSSYSQYGNNIDTRFSAKFHRSAGEFFYQELNSRPNKKTTNPSDDNRASNSDNRLR